MDQVSITANNVLQIREKRVLTYPGSPLGITQNHRRCINSTKDLTEESVLIQQLAVAFPYIDLEINPPSDGMVERVKLMLFSLATSEVFVTKETVLFIDGVLKAVEETSRYIIMPVDIDSDLRVQRFLDIVHTPEIIAAFREII